MHPSFVSIISLLLALASMYHAVFISSTTTQPSVTSINESVQADLGELTARRIKNSSILPEGEDIKPRADGPSNNLTFGGIDAGDEHNNAIQIDIPDLETLEPWLLVGFYFLLQDIENRIVAKLGEVSTVPDRDLIVGIFNTFQDKENFQVHKLEPGAW